jgi:nucleotide-binding universal stress UspA family protein
MIASSGTGPRAAGQGASEEELVMSVVVGVDGTAASGAAIRVAAQEARYRQAQLIVLATRGSMSRLLGTVSQYVLRKAPCPVMIVPAGPARASCRGTPTAVVTPA